MSTLSASSFVDVNTTPGLDNAIFFSAVPPRARGVTALFPHIKYSDNLHGLSVDWCFEQNENLIPLLKEVINKEILLGGLNTAITALKALGIDKKIDPKLYDLLSPLTVQERKLAMRFSYGAESERFVWNLQLPILFIERNAWLTLSNQWEIGQLTGAGGEAPPSEVLQETTFDLLGAQVKKFTHFAGLGNTLASFGVKIPFGDLAQGIAGLRLIAPTSTLASKNLLKDDLDIAISERDVPALAPLFKDSPQYRVLANVGKVLPKIRQIALNPLDTVPPAWATGVFLEGKMSFFEGKVDFWSQIECDYYYPYMVDRLVLVTQPISADAPNIFNTGVVPTTLPLQLPFEVQAKSKLGITGHAVQGVTLYSGEKGSFSFGYDIYHQAAECLEAHVSDEIIALMNTSVVISPSGVANGPVVLGVASELSQKRRLTQHRIFSNVKVEGFFSKTTSLMIGGDYALSSGGMGPSWAVYTRMKVDF